MASRSSLTNQLNRLSLTNLHQLAREFNQPIVADKYSQIKLLLTPLSIKGGGKRKTIEIFDEPSELGSVQTAQVPATVELLIKYKDQLLPPIKVNSDQLVKLNKIISEMVGKRVEPWEWSFYKPKKPKKPIHHKTLAKWQRKADHTKIMRRYLAWKYDQVPHGLNQEELQIAENLFKDLMSQ